MTIEKIFVSISDCEKSFRFGDLLTRIPLLPVLAKHCGITFSRSGKFSICILLPTFEEPPLKLYLLRLRQSYDMYDAKHVKFQHCHFLFCLVYRFVELQYIYGGKYRRNSKTARPNYIRLISFYMIFLNTCPQENTVAYPKLWNVIDYTNF